MAAAIVRWDRGDETLSWWQESFAFIESSRILIKAKTASAKIVAA